MSEGRLVSPTGTYWAELVSDDDDLARLRIGAVASSETYLSAVRWPTWFRLDIEWDADDRVWVDSGDVGVSVFQRDGPSWRRYFWDPVPSAPESEVLDVATQESLAPTDAEPPPRLRARHE